MSLIQVTSGKAAKEKHFCFPESLHPGSLDFNSPRINVVFSDHTPRIYNHTVERSVFAILLQRGHRGGILNMSFMDIFVVIYPPLSSEAAICIIFFRLAI